MAHDRRVGYTKMNNTGLRYGFPRGSLILVLAFTLLAGHLSASDWPNWRGPQQNGFSPEKGLISSWSVDGENQIWRADFIGRSTPVELEYTQVEKL